MDDGEDAELAHLDWIVWTLEVRDPEQRAVPDIGERTEQAMTEMAGSLGCVYSHCVDDDSYDLTPEGTYYAWSVRVSRSEHLRRNEHGVPIAVAVLWDYLRTQLPTGVDDWHVRPDHDLSLMRGARIEDGSANGNAKSCDGSESFESKRLDCTKMTYTSGVKSN